MAEGQSSEDAEILFSGRRRVPKNNYTVMMSCWVTQQQFDQILLISKNNRSRFLRASAELGLAVFGKRPDLMDSFALIPDTSEEDK